MIDLIEGNRYRARAGEPFAVSAEGATKQEAYRKLEELILARLGNGTDLVEMELSAGDQGARCAGSLADNPLFDEWQAAIAENRRREDAANP